MVMYHIDIFKIWLFFYLNQLLTIHQISLLETLQAMKNINNCIKLKIHT